MTRPDRQVHPGSWHHVMNRGIRRYSIFQDDDDRIAFLSELAQAAMKHQVTTVAFALMGNHYHLVLHCRTGELSAMMRDLASRYVRPFNRRHGFDGPLFRARFASKRIADDAQLLGTTRYVHRNPLELRQRIHDHPWTSYPHYLGFRTIPWVDASVPLGACGGSEAYRDFVERTLPADTFSASDGVESVAPSASVEPLVDRIEGAVRRNARRLGLGQADRRRSAIVVALDRGISSEVAATHFGFSSGASLRSAASRARVRALEDADLAALIRESLQQLDANRAA